ncbi:hypothetical protein L3X38_042039 [Prunus dulcis]|uniref:DUF668 domain-containing protein n=1 Tax=Prunus dulcis TaxID=3755 RepID=A0AAD4YKY3_PRUDU|nr:hypothetical protein L3X38_042039 [Prunus dulcis]
MQQLMTLVQNTAELYHELHALDRFEQDYRRKLQVEDNSNTTQRGDSLAILEQRFWKRSWRNLSTLCNFLHLEIHEAFGNEQNNHKKLGSAGLALHYANIISQIDTLVSRSSSVPPNTRDNLYQGLPPGVKSALRSKLQSFQVKEEHTVPEIKAEMEKTLQWLVPIATNTTKAHHGLWLGMENGQDTGSEMNRKPAVDFDIDRIKALDVIDRVDTIRSI